MGSSEDSWQVINDSDSERNWMKPGKPCSGSTTKIVVWIARKVVRERLFEMAQIGRHLLDRLWSCILGMQ